MKVVVFGANGRVGSAVCKIARARGHRVCQVDVSSPLPQEADVVIDFSSPSALETVLDLCERTGAFLVEGVTGYSESQRKQLEKLQRQGKADVKANFAQGEAIFEDICKFAATLLHNFDKSLVEMHRKSKVDKPSGTAKRLAETLDIADGDVLSIRGGTVFGKHQVVFAGQGEVITLTHEAENVEVFALGAVVAAEKAYEKRQ